MLPSTPNTAQTGAEGPASFREAAKQNSLAIFALVLSIMAVLGMLFVIGLVFSIAAIVAGHISYSRIKASGGKLTGNKITVASLIIGYFSGYISLLIMVIIIFVAVPAYQWSLPPREVRRQVTELKNATPDQRYDAVMKILSAGKQSEAEQLLDVLIRKYPSDQRLLLYYAVCARSRWSMFQSEWGFRRVLKLDPFTLEGNCARYVLELDERKNVPENMNALRLLIRQNPDQPFLLWIMGIECRDYYKHTREMTYSHDAQQCYRQLLEIFDVGPVMVHHTFANVLEEELDLDDEALQHHRTAVKMEPTSWTYEGLGITLGHMKKYDEANKVFAKMVQLSPDNADYWRHWAYSLEKQGRYEECIEKYKRVLELDPTGFMDYNTCGTCLIKQKKYEEALEIFQKSIKINPAQALAHTAAAEILEKLGRHAEAQSYLGKAFEWADRGNAEAQYNLGLCYEYGDGVATNFTKAVEWYQKAADQGYARAQFNLGMCYNWSKGVTNDMIKAAEWWQKAADQNHADAQYVLGECYSQGAGVTNDLAKAKEWYQKAAAQGHARAKMRLENMQAK